MRFTAEQTVEVYHGGHTSVCSDCFRHVLPGSGVAVKLSQEVLRDLGAAGLPPGEHLFCAFEQLDECERLARESRRKVFAEKKEPSERPTKPEPER